MTNPRAWKHEAGFVPSSLEETLELQRRLMDEAGATIARANGCVMWLLNKAHGRDDSSSASRAEYRKLLANLDGGDRSRPTGRKGPHYQVAVAA